MLGSENDLTHEYYSANINLKSSLYRFVQHDKPFLDMLIPSVSRRRLSRGGRVLCLNSFLKNKSQVQNKKVFHFVNVLRGFSKACFLNRACFHFDFLL